MKGFSGFPEGRLPSSANGNGHLRTGRTERASSRTVTPDPAVVNRFMAQMLGERPTKELVGHWHKHYCMGVPLSLLVQISGQKGHGALLGLFKEHGLKPLSDREREKRYRDWLAAGVEYVHYWYELYLRGVPPREILLVSGKGEMKEVLGLFVTHALSLLEPEEIEKRRAMYRDGVVFEVEIPPPPPAVPGEADRPLGAAGRPAGGQKTPAGVEQAIAEASEQIVYPPDLTLSELTRLNDLYLAGEPVADLAKEAQLSDPLKLFGLFREHDLPVRVADGGLERKHRGKGGPMPALGPDEVKALHCRYMEGEKAHLLAVEAGVTINTIYSHFNKLGLPMLGKRGKRELARETVDSLYQRYLAGEPMVKLAGEVGVTTPHLYGQFDKAGLPLKWVLAEAEAAAAAEVSEVTPAGVEELGLVEMLEVTPAVAEIGEAEVVSPESEVVEVLPPTPAVAEVVTETAAAAEDSRASEPELVTRPARRNLDYPALLALHKRYLAGEPISKICQEVGIGKTQLYERFRGAGLPTKWAVSSTPAESEAERLKLADVAERLDRLKMAIEAFGYEVRVTVEIRAYAEVDL